MTPDLDYIGYEYAYPVLADVVDDQLHIICQRDDEPGTSLTDADPTAENEWIYFGITTDLEIEDQVSIDEVKESPISIYPVPARDIAYVNLGGLGAVNMNVYNMVGGLVISQFENNNIATLDVSNLATGVYTLTVTKDVERYTSKLIVE